MFSDCSLTKNWSFTEKIVNNTVSVFGIAPDLVHLICLVYAKIINMIKLYIACYASFWNQAKLLRAHISQILAQIWYVGY